MWTILTVVLLNIFTYIQSDVFYIIILSKRSSINNKKYIMLICTIALIIIQFAISIILNSII